MKNFFFLFTFLTLPAFKTNAQSAALSKNEIKSERSMYSKVFVKDAGINQAIIYAAPIHYKKNNNWEDINTSITSNANGFQNETNVLRSYFPNTISSDSKIKLVINENDEVFIYSKKKLVLMNVQNVLSVIENEPANAKASVRYNSVNYEGIFANVSDQFEVLNGEIKNNVILNSLPSALNSINSGYFGFQETIELPLGWKIISSDNSQITNSSLYILNANGQKVLTIPAPVFFDNYGRHSDGSSMVEGKYFLKQENNQWLISTLVPVDWLKDSNTKYPVSIDPTVVIVGTTGGWQSPNNWVDNASFVFIGVCCSNLTHRAWIKFNISTIPSTSCITMVEIQPNVTTVANATSEGVLINDVTGAFGPYGGIVPAAYNDMGTGNYTSFNITTTGLYGYFNLGASASALLQSQIPGGWFEPAFQFVNEPSTNYKIITATSSNLRVTYVAPPCVLPIELLSFDAKCNNNKVNLTWTTASQLDNNFFTIERTVNGIDYESVGTVAGAGINRQTLNYSFVDVKPLEGISYYRLKQTDNNGQFKYLNKIAVNCKDVPDFKLNPNPNSGTFTIDGLEYNSDLHITDLFGQVIYQTKITNEKIEIDLSKHLNGVYFIQMTSKNATSSKKIIINK